MEQKLAFSFFTGLLSKFTGHSHVQKPARFCSQDSSVCSEGPPSLCYSGEEGGVLISLLTEAKEAGQVVGPCCGSFFSTLQMLTYWHQRAHPPDRMPKVVLSWCGCPVILHSPNAKNSQCACMVEGKALGKDGNHILRNERVGFEIRCSSQCFK